MASFNLLREQREILTVLCDWYENRGFRNFYFFFVDQGGAQFMFRRPGENDQRVGTNATEDDLVALANEDLIGLHYSSAGRLIGGSVKQAAVDALKDGFKRPLPFLPPSLVQTFFAPVGAVHLGPGDITIGKQNIGATTDEVVRLLGEMRRQIDLLGADNRQETAELLDDLTYELKQDIPKQSRIKAYLASLWTAASGVAEFAANITQLAGAYGIDSSTFG